MDAPIVRLYALRHGEAFWAVCGRARPGDCAALAATRDAALKLVTDALGTVDVNLIDATLADEVATTDHARHAGKKLHNY